MADPLPQAFVLTAIVITLAVTVIMLMLAVLGHNDDTHLMPPTGEVHDR
jgi:multicomponent Na+:H+ antiporter subunit C